jgi:hypothetical protein
MQNQLANLRICEYYFNCGEEGYYTCAFYSTTGPFTELSSSHNKAECPNPAVEREFTGTCRKYD